MKNSFLSVMTKAVTKFKDKDRRQQEKLDSDVLNYYDAVTTPDQNRNSTIPNDKTVLMKNSIKEEMSAFFLETSFTALTQIYKANSLWKRVVWTVVVIVMLVWMSIQCYWLLEKYYRYPVEVKMDLKVSTVLEFPSVTICNLNPILETNVFSDPYTPLIKYAEPDNDDLLYKETMDNWDFNQNCGPDDHKCDNGICVHWQFVCDGIHNCMSGEDEKDCEDYQCPRRMWKCTSRPKCIHVYYRCDDDPGDCSKNTTEDEDGCENYQCPDYMWKCSSEKKCIPAYLRCDGYPGACNENTTEDEDGCEDYQCPSNMWKCTSMPKCISAYLRCDGYPGACNENTTEDEDGCDNYQCPHFMWKCPSQPKCISAYSRCDGYPGSCNTNTTEDEEDCQNNTCPDGYFRCSSGRCIPSFFVCDKTNDCEDDELNCTAQNKTNKYIRNEMTSNSSGTFDMNAMFQNTSFNKWKILENGFLSSNFSFYEERDDEYEAAMTYAYITAKLSPSFVEQSGHLKIDLIAACKFGGYQCSPMNFTYFHSHKFGNCYTFNSKVNNSAVLTTRFPGPENGLRLELFLDQENYVANLAADAGARILVHKKGSMPFPEDEGISIMPGRSTSIGVRQISFSRLPPPHGSCGDAGKTRDYYGRYFGTDYSKLACLKSCYQDIAINYCGCAVPLYFVPNNVTVCNMTDREIEHCVISLPCNYSKSYEICDTLCPVPCTETKYELSISSAIWPSERYKSYLEKRLDQTNYLYRNIHDSDKEFTKLQIYFEDLIYEQVEQEKGYESMNLISDFGGQLGLWLGLSAITLGEICSFLFGVGRSLSFKWWGNKIKPVQNDLTPIMYIKPATLEEMFEEMCPEAANYSPPEMTTPLPGSTGT